MMKLKRVCDTPSPSDGYRILVDRLWPRGLSEEHAKVEQWRKDLAPSDGLRKWFHHDPARWDEFRRRYRRELELANKMGDLEELARRAQGESVTLLFAAKETEHNNAVALRQMILNLCGERMALSARRVPFEQLIELLLAEHRQINARLADLEDALGRKDRVTVATIAPSLRDELNQHMLDEEAQVLRLLIQVHGRARSSKAIGVFQQHKAIHQLVGEIAKQATMGPERLRGMKRELEALLKGHIGSEEKSVFPLALRAYRETREAPKRRKS